MGWLEVDDEAIGGESLCMDAEGEHVIRLIGGGSVKN